MFGTKQHFVLVVKETGKMFALINCHLSYEEPRSVYLIAKCMCADVRLSFLFHYFCCKNSVHQLGGTGHFTRHERKDIVAFSLSEGLLTQYCMKGREKSIWACRT